MISMFILLIMIPALFFCFIHLVSDSQKTMQHERFQMNWLSAYLWMQREIKQGVNFRMERETLLFDLPTGETVKYRWDQGRIVRQIRQRENEPFKGYTVLLEEIKAYRFFPYRSGVLLAFTFSNDYSVRTFIRGRIEAQ